MQKCPLNETHLRRLQEYAAPALPPCTCLKFKAGETVLREGWPIDYLLIVAKGKAKVCFTAQNGRDLVLCYYISEGILGDVELMTGSALATTSVVAITALECIALPLATCAPLLKNSVPFLNRLGRELSQKLLSSSQNRAAASLCSGQERLCAYILQNAPQGIFSEPLTNVACSIGTSYRHTLRLLSGLCAAGLLQKTGQGYRIASRTELQRSAAQTF